MGSSAKKKKEKKKDFQKPKLKVGKARPKNTNATDTSFSAKSIVFKQQNLQESVRDEAALFAHNLSLLSSKSDTQRRDALAYLTTICSTHKSPPQPASAILAKSQPLILDGSSQVRSQLLKLWRCLPAEQIGSLDQLILYTRAGMAHLSNDIRMSALDVLDWLIDTNGEAVVSTAGGWIKTLRTFQTLLAWHDPSTRSTAASNQWSSSRSTNVGSGSKLLVHQLTTLSAFLTKGLIRPSLDDEKEAAAKRAADLFPLWHTDAHMLPKRSSAFGYLNLFGTARDEESEIYESAEERCEIFSELGLLEIFTQGVNVARREGGEVGRAAGLVDKALHLVDKVG